MNNFCWLIAIIAAFTVAISANPASASPTTRTVPGQYSTIKAAINAAHAGDTVLVSAGTYTGSGNVDLDTQGKAITIKSVSGASQTVINCQSTDKNPHRGFNIHNGEKSTTVIEGFTIENGWADFGGGISVTGASVTIEQCAFINDTAIVGGAINVYDGGPLISQDYFHGNSAGTNHLLGVGGAVAVEQDYSFDSTPTVSDCVFISNSASVDGAALFIAGTKSILNGGPCTKGVVAGATVVNCSFTSNSTSATTDGDGDGDGDNDGDDIGASKGKGGTIAFYGGGATITNTILYGDSTPSEISSLFPSSNVTAEYSDIQGGVSGVGNMDANPQYINPTGGNLQLSNGSLCIGAGIANSNTPLVDILGNTFGPYPAMGAYAHALVATHLVVTGPGAASAGTPVTVTVTAKDQYGHTVTTYGGTVAITSSDGAANLPSSGGLTNGTGQFNVTLNSGGSQTITATDTSNSSITGSLTLGVTYPAPTVVTPAAANPNPVTGTTVNLSALGGYTGPGGQSALSYTWSATGPGTVIYSDNGDNSAQNTAATFTQAGTYIFTVTISNGEGGTVTSQVTVTVDQTITSIVVSPNPDSISLGGGDTFTGIAYDQFGTALGTQPVFSWSVDAGGVGSIDPTLGIYTAGFTPGTATVRGTSGSVSGTASVTVTDPGPSVATPAAANPNPVTGTTVALSALGSDLAGASGLTYTWSATGPAAVTYSDNGDNTAQNTTATFTAAGSYVFTVTITNPSSESVTSVVDVTVSQTVTSITVNPGPSISFLSPAVQQFSATAYDQFGNAFSTPPTFSWTLCNPAVLPINPPLCSSSVGAIDINTGLYHSGPAPGTATVVAYAGSVIGTCAVTVSTPAPTVATPATATPSIVKGTATHLLVLGAYTGIGGAGALTYTWSETSGPAPVTFSANGTTAARNILATFSQAGSYTLMATISNAYGQSITSSVNVTVNQTLTSIAVTPGPTLSLTLVTTQQFSASANDQFGNPMSPQPAFVWVVTAGSEGSVNSTSGFYHTGFAPGSATVEAVYQGITGSCVITIIAPPVTVTTAANASPSTVTGTTTNLNVLGGWAAPGGQADLTYTWAETSGPSGATFSANGTNASNNTTVTFTQVGTYTFTATIADPFGGTTTSSVNVTVVSTVSAITVTPGPTLTLGPPLPQTQQFSATAYDQFNNLMSPQPTFAWQLVVGGVGSVGSTSGFYHSGTVAGTATIKAKVGSVFGSTVVTVN